jgi:hypothetical protein
MAENGYRGPELMGEPTNQTQRDTRNLVGTLYETGHIECPWNMFNSEQDYIYLDRAIELFDFIQGAIWHSRECPLTHPELEARCYNGLKRQGLQEIKELIEQLPEKSRYRRFLSEELPNVEIFMERYERATTGETE